MNILQNLISENIKASGGQISFAEYMYEVLYHPQFGYYNRSDMTIGETGDFYTSPMVHSIFGQCVARQVYQLWQQMDSPQIFTILEMGAGTGNLARDLLAEWDRLQQKNQSRIPNLQYHIIEQSPILKKKQFDTTKSIAGGRIHWQSKLEEVPGFGSITGIILSNELFDALPVHRLRVVGGQLQELFVTVKDTDDGEITFCEIDGPLSNSSIRHILTEDITKQLAEGDRLEVCLQAGTVLQTMADALKSGYVMTIDYGDLSSDVYRKSLRSGGIRCYYKQRLSTDPYQRIGEQDITADVDFSYLQRTGMERGLRTVQFMTQSIFLEKMGFLNKVAELQRLAFQDLRADFEMQKMLTLYLPQGLGEACKVLIQAKG